MLLDKWVQLHSFSIWEPRYSDQRVLLKCSKVGEHNKIVFTKSKSMGTDPYYVSGKAVKKYAKQPNGATWVYAVPLHELSPLELSTNSVLDLY